MPILKILRGREVGRILDLADENFLGRDETNTFRLQDETCSRHHAKVVRLDDAWVVVDLGSNNGTFVNGETVKEKFLRNGDQVLVGKTLLVFEGHTESTTAAVTVHEAHTEFRVESSVPADQPKPETSRLRQLYEIAALCNTLREPRALLERLATAVADALGADVAVALLDGEDPAVRGHGNEVRVSRSAVVRARKERHAMILAAETLGGQSVVDEDIRSVAVAPFVRGDRVLGALYADRRGERPGFTEDDLAFLNASAHQAALALDREVAAARTRERMTELVGERRTVGSDPAWREVLRLVEKTAASDATVLILGESGTGKELVARALHDQSPRRDGPFVAINCGAIVETLVESELFGYEKGAFTGAFKRHRGKFEAAADGTVFLDEIGEISPGLQAKLLRVLQERTFFRVGGTEPVAVDVRVLAATNRDLSRAVKEARFREDLFYRLSVVSIRVPALRERMTDLPALCTYFLGRSRRRFEIETETMAAMRRYTWPGNIRELQNVLERCTILADGETIGLALLPPEIRGAVPEEDGWPIKIEEAEKLCLQRALAKTGGKKGQAAKLLGISWPTLNKKLKDYGLGS